jgi:hypothetical protein
VPKSTTKGFEAQIKRLAEFRSVAYRMPFAVEETARLVLYFLKNRIRLNERYFVRCSDELESPRRNSVLMGGFQLANGFSISKCAADYPFPMIGSGAFSALFSSGT